MKEQNDSLQSTAPGRRGRLAAAAVSAWCVLAAMVWGCSSEQIRDWTYPPGFNYVSSGELRSTMSQIATEVAALDALLRDSDTADASRHARVVQRLRALDAAAQRLGPGGWPSNHPRISDNAAWFQSEIARALSAAQQDPPQYYFAGTLSGSCSICHATRRP